MEQQRVAARLVDTAEYVGVLRGLVEEGHEVSMLVSGSSMSPFLIHLRDTIYFKKPDRPLRAGDIVFYQRDSGQYVMHRILRARGDVYDIIGDAQTEVERGVRRDQIFAIITRVKRKGKLIGPGDFWWTFFARVWTKLIPLRPLIAWAYARLIR
ncbi:MAG: S24/S26 family peptidase [Clostridia bacterium]|nr:S24/S26 family peptidase [Clostridia bacterium]